MSLRLLGFDRKGVVVGIDGQDGTIGIANLIEDGLPSGILGQGYANLCQPCGGRLANQPSGGEIHLVSVSHVQGLVEGQDGDAVHVVDAERLERLAGDAGFAHVVVVGEGEQYRRCAESCQEALTRMGRVV